jgi:hypothetical protein
LLHWPPRLLSRPRQTSKRRIGTALMTFAPLSKMRFRSVRSSPSLCSRKCRNTSATSDQVWTSSLGIPKDHPSTVQSTKRPLQRQLPKKKSLRREAATPPTRAIHAVSHDHDGFLRLVPRRFVAPCCRPWGSLRFTHPPPGSLHRRERRPQGPAGGCPPRSAEPFEAFPSTAALIASPRPVPSRH